MNRIRVLETLLALSLGLIVFSFLFKVQEVLYASLAVALIAFIPWPAHWLAFGWLKITEWISFLISRFLLIIVFYLILSPLSLIRRMLRKKNKKTGSFYVERNYLFQASDLENPW